MEAEMNPPHSWQYLDHSISCFLSAKRLYSGTLFFLFSMPASSSLSALSLGFPFSVFC